MTVGQFGAQLSLYVFRVIASPVWYKKKRVQIPTLIHLCEFTYLNNIAKMFIWRQCKEKKDAILDFLSLKVCQHFANLPLDTCSEDVEVWVRKKTLLYPREINLCLSFIHYSFHKDAGGAAAFFSTLWIRSTAAALSHKNGVSASPRKQDKSRNRNSICLRLLVPLGFLGF